MTKSTAVFAFASLLAAAASQRHGPSPAVAPRRSRISLADRRRSDGTRIAFVTNGDLAMMSVDGASVTRLTSSVQDVQHPDWSPDSTRIVFSVPFAAACDADGVCEGPIDVVNVDGSGLAQVGSGRNPAWSPSGSGGR